ncbi:MAG: class I SAM-dependent methyltransferase [Myxococcota bacterium]
MSTRHISSEEARILEPGSEHYTAYVGPPRDYDFMGATQFRLLCTLGLRAQHRLLDFGCGSLRVGRMLIPYLQPGHYYGVEPNRWLIDDAIEHEVGADLIRIKTPQFLYHDTFSCREFDVRFDYILAQSIFSHCGADLITRILGEFAESLSEEGIVAATFIHSADRRRAEPEEGWVYPDEVSYSAASITELLEGSGLQGCPIPWQHPRQTWWLLARNASRLPDPERHHLLRGEVLHGPPLAEHEPSS